MTERRTFIIASMRPFNSFVAAAGWPGFRRLLAAIACCLSLGAVAADDVAETTVRGSDFQSAHDGLIEAIETEGLVVSAVIPFNGMLARTAAGLARKASPFAHAEIVQFCSSLLAWQLLEEEASQIALCPLSIALFVTTAEPEQVKLAYRLPGASSPGRLRAENLLRRLVDRAASLARQRW